MKFKSKLYLYHFLGLILFFSARTVSASGESQSCREQNHRPIPHDIQRLKYLAKDCGFHPLAIKLAEKYYHDNPETVWGQYAASLAAVGKMQTETKPEARTLALEFIKRYPRGTCGRRYAFQMLSWHAIKNQDYAAAINYAENYLAEYPKGTYADVVAIRLESARRSLEDQ